MIETGRRVAHVAVEIGVGRHIPGRVGCAFNAKRARLAIPPQYVKYVMLIDAAQRSHIWATKAPKCAWVMDGW